jgi:hypothetical protein
MIIPVKLKPFREWPGACPACRTEGYETVMTEREAQKLSGMWVEIDTAHPIVGRYRSWHTTADSFSKLLFPGFTVTEREARPLIFCEHQIAKHSLITGKLLVLAHRIGILRRFPEKKVVRNADPLVGKLFLCVRRCAGCHAVRIDGRGEVLERIPGVDAYVVEPYALGPKFIRGGFLERVMGNEMSDWQFYESSLLLLRAQELLEQTQATHDQQQPPPPLERPN